MKIIVNIESSDSDIAITIICDDAIMTVDECIEKVSKWIKYEYST